jgi:hypothetical protein
MKSIKSARSPRSIRIGHESPSNRIKVADISAVIFVGEVLIWDNPTWQRTA